MIRGVLHHHRDYLPVTDKTPMISLGEGDTPMVKSINLARKLGIGELHFKLEGCNPTGSFKDRGMVVAIAKAIEEGSEKAICASTGNTSASAAAYGARFGLKVIIIVPKGKIAVGKLAQAIAYGAEIVSIDGNFDRALNITKELVDKYPVTLVNSLNPFRIEGQKTSSFEIIEDLGCVPDYVFLPVGNAGNITAYWKGFKEWKTIGKVDKTPVMMGFQAEGAAPIVKNRVIDAPQTIATAIRIGNPASWKQAVAARDESGGIIDSVTDEEILEAYKLMAGSEGVFGEPASAAPLAGLLNLLKQGKSFKDKKIVCIVTGNGLKDPDIPTKYVGPFPELPADTPAIERHLGFK